MLTFDHLSYANGNVEVPASNRAIKPNGYQQGLVGSGYKYLLLCDVIIDDAYINGCAADGRRKNINEEKTRYLLPKPFCFVGSYRYPVYSIVTLSPF